MGHICVGIRLSVSTRHFPRGMSPSTHKQTNTRGQTCINRNPLYPRLFLHRKYLYLLSAVVTQMWTAITLNVAAAVFAQPMALTSLDAVVHIESAIENIIGSTKIYSKSSIVKWSFTKHVWLCSPAMSLLMARRRYLREHRQARDDLVWVLGLHWVSAQISHRVTIVFTLQRDTHVILCVFVDATMDGSNT